MPQIDGKILTKGAISATFTIPISHDSELSELLSLSLNFPESRG